MNKRTEKMILRAIKLKEQMTAQCALIAAEAKKHLSFVDDGMYCGVDGDGCLRLFIDIADKDVYIAIRPYQFFCNLPPNGKYSKEELRELNEM